MQCLRRFVRQRRTRLCQRAKKTFYFAVPEVKGGVHCSMNSFSSVFAESEEMLKKRESVVFGAVGKLKRG